MPYTKHTWTNGSGVAINATHLNEMETGIAAAPYGPDATGGFVPVADGSGAWVYEKLPVSSISGYPSDATKFVDGSGAWRTLASGDIPTLAASKLSGYPSDATKVLGGDGTWQQVLTGGKVDPSKISGYPSDGTKVLKGDGSWGTVSSTTYRKTTTKQVVSSVTETDLLNGEITIAAGVMGTTGVLRLTAWGDWVQHAGSTQGSPRFKLKLGSTTLIDTNTAAATITDSVNRFPFRFVCEIGNLGAANSQWATMTGRYTAGIAANGVNAFTTGEGFVYYLLISGGAGFCDIHGTASGAVDTTASQVLALTVTLPTSSASVDCTLKGALVEIV